MRCKITQSQYNHNIVTIQSQYNHNMVKVIDNGCPVCKGSVSGNKKLYYLCGKCNMLFKRPASKTLYEKTPDIKPEVREKTVKYEEQICVTSGKRKGKNTAPRTAGKKG